MTKQANHANRIPWIGRLGSLTSTCMELLSHNTRRGGAMMQQHTRSFGIRSAERFKDRGEDRLEETSLSSDLLLSCSSGMRCTPS
jgi:hypothetical protein